MIFLIGDGMGLSQIVAAAYANKGLTLMNFNYIGLQRNNAKGYFTTDSAAGGSALATGERHANRHISTSEEGQPYPSLSDHFREKGLPVGVVTLGNVADATPAAFYGHSVERDNADELTRCLLDAPVDLLCGSGIRQFTERGDGLDMEKGTCEELPLRPFDRPDQRREGQGRLHRRTDGGRGRGGQPPAAGRSHARRDRQTAGAGDGGFFLMVEGAKIDYAGHSRCLPGSVIEMLSFDMAVAEALKFADSNGETLVVVTADHETGGLTLLDGDEQTGRITGIYVSDDHTPVMLPVFAYGPGADRFCGTYLNTEIARRIRSLTE